MQLEIEQKYPIADSSALVERLAQFAPTYLGESEQHDTYYNHPARDFRVTGEALRIRREDDKAAITYKGQKHTTAVKTRQEIELPLSEPDAWRSLLTTLGFRAVATVSKCRNCYRLSRSPFEVEIARPGARRGAVCGSRSHRRRVAGRRGP